MNHDMSDKNSTDYSDMMGMNSTDNSDMYGDSVTQSMEMDSTESDMDDGRDMRPISPEIAAMLPYYIMALKSTCHNVSDFYGVILWTCCRDIWPSFRC